ncbi:MAG: hypothetical protein OHK0015_51600 [Chloroflexi bacterium OHK40]
MVFLDHLPGLLLALMGWAATVLAIDGASRLTPNDRRAMVVCSWLLWMIPGLGTLVMRGLISTDTAALSVTFTTIVLGAIVLVGALRRPRSRP